MSKKILQPVNFETWSNIADSTLQEQDEQRTDCSSYSWIHGERKFVTLNRVYEIKYRASVHLIFYFLFIGIQIADS